MGQSWTPEQKKVIDTRNKNILVSAAAGSGKTAVLVERIIQRITSEQDPIDIDRLLVVTFTKAAAAEMRERVATAIDKKREAEPENENLIRQSSLVHNAMITTIDSFCLFVVRNHFEEIHLDPNFRIADEGEISLLQTDVIKEVFEKEYAKTKEENEDFFRLISSYAGTRNDSRVKEMVLSLYKKSSSSPWPKEWLQSLADIYGVEDQKEFLGTPIFDVITRHTVWLIQDLCEQEKRLLSLSLEPDGPTKYADTLAMDIELLEDVKTVSDYASLCAYMDTLKFANLPQMRNFDGDGVKKETVANGRKSIKDEIEKIKKKYFQKNSNELFEQMRRLRPFVQELVRLTLVFTEGMDAIKRKKRMMDFSDIEHFALKILVDEKTKEVRETAEEFKRHFDEIMIDEYQDSNQVQEAILTAIARKEDGQQNMFMVGDVKQSIYRFRMACPELFMDKYKAYAKESDAHVKIDLHKNFRSRKEVLDFSNDIFYKIMQPDLGEVAYDDNAALYCGASYEESEQFEAEFLLFDSKDRLLEETKGGLAWEDLEEDLDKKQLEARLVGSCIRRLMKDTLIKDKESGQKRPMRYSDIVILFRSIKNWGSTFAEVLAEMGIPAHVESSTGYFAAPEVQTILNVLRILDNPYQDIPMASMLKSPIVGLDNEELAQIRINHDNLPFSLAAMEEMKESTDERLSSFFKFFQTLREEVNELPIHELIYHIFEKTGYKDYVTLLPAGQKRAANLQMLLEKAIAYEKTSYKGLFHFIRYIDQLEKYDIDFGEADVTSENADVVHIMTIHKSKGLEFPVVFVSGMAKKINFMETSDKLVVHDRLGIGLEEVLQNPKRKMNTPIRNEIAEYIKQETLGEELRVLYVALTRAKEKLILTGIVDGKEKLYEKYTGNVKEKMPISYYERVKAVSYLDWMIPAMLSYPGKYDIKFVEPQELVVETAQEAGKETLEYVTLLDKIHAASDENIAAVKKYFSFAYPYQKDVKLKIKYSVSELKHLSMAEKYDAESEAEKPAFLLHEKEAYIPAFARKEEEALQKQDSGVNRGALRGTAVHRVMECLDFAKINEIDCKDADAVRTYVHDELSRMTKCGELTEEMRSLIYPSNIESFVKNGIASRMASAATRGQLFIEKPFVMKENDVLIQGIIDVFWMEEDALVLLDYKTDHIEHADELVKRYKTQLDLYADALRRIFSKEEKEVGVKEELIYSFALKEVINL